MSSATATCSSSRACPACACNSPTPTPLCVANSGRKPGKQPAQKNGFHPLRRLIAEGWNPFLISPSARARSCRRQSHPSLPARCAPPLFCPKTGKHRHPGACGNLLSRDKNDNPSNINKINLRISRRSVSCSGKIAGEAVERTSGRRTRAAARAQRAGKMNGRAEG